MNKDFCGTAMPSEKNNILEFKQHMKLDKMPYIIYPDIESLIIKIDGCANNPDNDSTTEIVDLIPCGYSISRISAFDHIENKDTLYRGKDCMKNVCTSSRKHTKNIPDFEKQNVTVSKIK